MRNSIPVHQDNLKKPFEILPDDMSHRKYVGNNLNEKTIGIIGLGNIGQKIGSIAEGFNMNILGYNRSEKNISGIQQTSLDDILTSSDIIAVTVPYSDETHKLLNEKKINLMKKGVVIVNISSQDILDEEILIQKLQNNEIGGYGLDNFTNKDKGHFFYNSEKVMILPHLGFFTQESLDMIGVRMLEALNGFLEGKDTHRIL